MYSTCLFCNQSLGTNESIEAMPIGRRLAFDGAKGRLWVVCRKCQRWNLTPFEERWEALEQCERAFRDTRLRVSTDNIGLARLPDGTELVRIGSALRPELAAWRYGDQFGRRRRRYAAMLAGGAVVGGAVLVAGPVMGLVSVGGIAPLFNILNSLNVAYRSRKMVRLTLESGETIAVRQLEVRKSRLTSDRAGWGLVVEAHQASRFGPVWYRRFDADRVPRTLTGADAVRAAGLLLPSLNVRGAATRQVQDAVSLLERAKSPETLFGDAALEARRRFESRSWQFGEPGTLTRLPYTMRLALEMAAHEESERRALEGELASLEAAWKDAEEIAGIADEMLLPESVSGWMRKLKHQEKREDEPGK